MEKFLKHNWKEATTERELLDHFIIGLRACDIQLHASGMTKQSYRRFYEDVMQLLSMMSYCASELKIKKRLTSSLWNIG